MASSDPHILEVKTSDRLGKRGRRQLERIERISSFLASDYSPNLRQLGPANRLAYTSEELHYRNHLNRSITAGLANGTCISKLEEGMWLAIIRADTTDIPSAFSTMDSGQIMLSFWNQRKNDKAWSPYRPFVLSIDDVSHLIAFIEGDITILVVVNIDNILDDAKNWGLDLMLTDDANYFLELVANGTDPTLAETSRVRISTSMFNRVNYELVSCKWLILEAWEIAKSVPT